ncbi:putative 3-hydroxyisobutyryl-CoA hydrolase 2 [Zea mays]|uniref:3-hydroxyisobutyryl-CoA hydrolase n=1 Tax=Zea mays TaxID=4577 RepID=A0A3L6FTE1_MAIZE|nr:putative 3-hydroxyisobutyryl-CoA hydrolase 2 [Zea mays]
MYHCIILYFGFIPCDLFLAREYVALVGARLDGAEMLACGLATHFVPSNRMLLLEESVKKVDTSNSFVVCSTIDQFCQQPSLKQKSSLNRLEIINKCFSKRTVEEIISSLIREGRTQTVGECLQREYRMVCHVVRGDFSRDIFEGCRAILVDKDKNPKWMPPRLEQVHDDAVEEYFSRVDDLEWEDLDLPVMCSNGRIMESKL